ncbi:helix-turn-helix transcriptional regulator [bacterium]|nr:helix-turn-helix transcriptional regulator [bacterium]
MKHTQTSLSLVAGANLKRLIEGTDITQEEVAEKLNYSEGSCIRRLYRTGISDIDLIQKIADIFEISLSEMLKPID